MCVLLPNNRQDEGAVGIDLKQAASSRVAHASRVLQ